MTVTFATDILPEPQKCLWRQLGHTPREFVLYGGTALALRLGHRESLDFNFFSHRTFQPNLLRQEIPYLNTATTTQESANTLTCVLNFNGAVHVSFFGGLALRSIQEPDRAEGPEIHVASLIDIAATKMLSIQQRASAKDFIDIDALIDSGLTLADALGAAQSVFGPSFNPLLTLKALTYFDDGNLSTVPVSVRENLQKTVKDIDLKDIPDFPFRDTLYTDERKKT